MAWAIGTVAVVVIILFSRKAGLAAVAFLSLVYFGLWIFSNQQGTAIPSNRTVEIAASSDPTLCPAAGEPVSVVFKNNADKPLENASFSLTARKSGHSSVVYRASLRSDKIIAPGDSYSTCYGLNPRSFAISTEAYDPRSLDWFAEISLAKFSAE